MTRRKQSKRSLKRLKASKSHRETVLIVCEGIKTECNYFEALRQKLRWSNVEVTVKSKKRKSAPIRVVKYAISLKKIRINEAKISLRKSEYDRIWCVMDVEAPKPHGTLGEACKKAKLNEIKVALSNPCFEFWFLLHYEKANAYIQSCDKVIKKLKKCYSSYKKSDSGIFNAIYSNTNTAIKNSRQVIKDKIWGEDLTDCNPSTHVHLIVEYLVSIIDKPIPPKSK